MQIRLFTCLLFLLMPLGILAQGAGNSDKINVYIDCRGCNESYIRNEISFVNFVRDQAVAQIHLLITRQNTGSGGRQYQLNFLGQGMLASESRETMFSSSSSDTEDEIRTGLVNQIKLGLLPYLSNNSVLNDISVIYQPNEDTESSPIVDKWNNWVFEFGMSSYFNGEESRKSLNFNSDVEVRRVTENWKTEFNYRYNYNRRTFVSEDSLGNEEEDVFVTENQRFFGLAAKSLSEHWTVGSYYRAISSTRDNYDLRAGITPSVEYSLFPYSEYAQREVTFRYGLMTYYNNYTEPTIFNKTEEFLLMQEFAARMEFTQPWGEIEGRLNAMAYTHDFSKNRMDLNFEIDFRVTRNLSVFFSGRYSMINDQINIAAGNTTDEELLLNLRQQSTSYSYGGSVGFEITFGSIYNNVVNTRL